jgi:hypothetical protein
MIEVIQKAKDLISDDTKGYFAAKSAEKCVKTLIEKSDKYKLLLVSTGEYVNFDDQAVYGLEVRAVKTADSKG